MKKRSIFIAIILFIIMGAIAAILLSESGNHREAEVQWISLRTDKDLYHSKENMNISVTIAATTDMDNLTLVFEGVGYRYREKLLSKNLTISLVRGRNDLSLNYPLPVCSKCAGLSPGVYSINVTLIKQGVQIGAASCNVTFA